MKAWYALYTKPNAEIKVARALCDQALEAYLPLLPAKPDRRAEPLFPCYLFVQCDLAATETANLAWTPGLRRIVKQAGSPAVVPDAAITLIKTNLRQIETQGGLPNHPFKPGDPVVIQEGPLAGLRGIFQGPLGSAERVQILLHFLGAANRTEVPVSQLRPAPEAGGAPEARLRRRSTRGHGRRIHNNNERAPHSAAAAVP
jgi:transcriptional antiterminator RfaH